VWSFNRYDSPWDVVRLLWYGILENFGYRQWKTIVAWHGLIEYLRGDQSWGVMRRKGFGTDTDTAAAGGATGAVPARSRDDPVVHSDASTTTGDESGFVWVDWLDNAPETEGFRGLSRLATDDSTGRVRTAADISVGVGVGDGGFVWTTDFSDGVDDGGFVWTTEPTRGAGDGGFAFTVESNGETRIVSTTEFSDRVGDGGFVWTTDPTLGVGDGGVVWTRDADHGTGDVGFVWVATPDPDGATTASTDDSGFVWLREARDSNTDTGFVWLRQADDADDTGFAWVEGPIDTSPITDSTGGVTTDADGT
jgi:hypothetical protein